MHVVHCTVGLSGKKPGLKFRKISHNKLIKKKEEKKVIYINNFIIYYDKYIHTYIYIYNIYICNI